MPEIPVVVLTSCKDADGIIRSLLAGASGYLVKLVAYGQLIEAIDCASQGRLALCHEAKAVLVSCFHRVGTTLSPKQLTRREEQVLALLAQGPEDKQIAEVLGISHHTVHVHLVHIFAKLAVSSREEAFQKIFGPQENCG